jgi:anaerobic magnesium-protoporphyrin IX monomethyl ester cyclase
MKTPFFQREWFAHLGIMSLAAILRGAGYSVRCFVASGERNLFAAVGRYAPDIACFSCTSGEHQWALALAQEIKERWQLFTVFGGAHPTFFPDIIQNPFVDCICRGEGDHALLDLVRAKAQGEAIHHIKNLYIKENGNIIRNDLRPLIKDLDCLPFPDRSIYDAYPRLQMISVKHVMASRGCSFSCSYCFNHVFKKIYGEPGGILRFRSPEHVIAEIKAIKECFGIRTLVFEDDVFVADQMWLYRFLGKYQHEISIPFICNVHASCVSDETARRLKDAGCFRVAMGVETADEELRINVLHKQITNSQIITAAACLKKYAIKLLTNNMMGLPGETIDEAFETVALNIQIKSDFPWCSLLQPYPSTEIEQYAINRGYLIPHDCRPFETTFYKQSLLNLKDSKQINNLQKLFYIAIKFPRLLPLIRKAVFFPPNVIYRYIFLITFAMRYKKSYQLGLIETIFFCWKNRLLYKD